MINISDEYKKYIVTLEEEDSAYIDKKTLIVDALNLYMRCFAGTPTLNDDGDHIGGVVGFIKSLASIIRLVKPTQVIIVFDGRGGSQRRRSLFSEYKEHRRTMVRLNRAYNFLSVEEEQKSQKWQLVLLYELLQCLPVTIIAQDNVEADDVIAYLTQCNEEQDKKSVILSTDKDFHQLVSENTSIYNGVKKKFYTIDEILNEYGVHPKNFVLFRIFDGDSSDNIPGVKGVGLKTLLKRYPELKDDVKYDLKYILTKATEESDIPLSKKILANENLLERNLELMRLDEVAMSATTKITVLDKVRNYSVKNDKVKFLKIAGREKLSYSFSDRFDSWYFSSFSYLTKFI